MHNASSSPTLINCTFSSNSASGIAGDSGFGGGMYNISSSPILINCSFSGNSSRSHGGGMFNTSASSPTLTNCTFSRSSAIYGGGMCNFSSSPTLTNCTFIDNSASSGGGVYNASSSPTLANCSFSSNWARYNGGGIYNSSSSSPALINSTFRGNVASSGGGMYHDSSSSTLTNCTFSGNAASYGGGITTSAASLTLTNCILWGNTAPSSPQIYHSGGAVIVTYCDIQGGYDGVGNIDADPLFASSPWTGPDGVFSTADDDYGDVRLREGSPALDIGSNVAITAEVGTDLAGNTRVQNGTVDMGAYEGAVLPKTLYVDIAATSGASTGASWADAFTNLQSALLAGRIGDTIRIADGTYRPTSTTDRTLGFALRDHVAIYGGYAGYGAPDPDARDIVLYPTILSGDRGHRDAWKQCRQQLPCPDRQ